MLDIKRFPFLIIVTLLFSCSDGKWQPQTPAISFIAPFPKRNIDLTDVLGNELALKKGNDTINLKVSSYKNFNLIINKQTKDTLFIGKVCRIRGLLYFNQQLNDTSYWIYAVKVTDHLIYGLNSAWEQSEYVKQEIRKGNNHKLVQHINADSSVIRLFADKKEMKKIFSKIIEEIEPDTIIEYPKKPIQSKMASTVPENFDPEDFVLLSKAYPNPTRDILNIELQEKNNVSYHLADINGKPILHGNFTETTNRIDMGNQENGVYFLTLSDQKRKLSESFKIIKTE